MPAKRRTVVLPFFDVAMQAGADVAAKRIDQVAVNFPAAAAAAAVARRR